MLDKYNPSGKFFEFAIDFCEFITEIYCLFFCRECLYNVFIGARFLCVSTNPEKFSTWKLALIECCDF